jgi:hypothetical protein
VVWRPKPKIDALGLNISGTCRKPLESGSRRPKAAGEGPIKKLGGWNPRYKRGGRFGARNRISMGSMGKHWIMLVGGCYKAGRAGTWDTRGVGGLAPETKNRA